MSERDSHNPLVARWFPWRWRHERRWEVRPCGLACERSEGCAYCRHVVLKRVRYRVTPAPGAGYATGAPKGGLGESE